MEHSDLPKLSPLTCPTGEKPAGDALDSLVCILDRLKILDKLNHHGHIGQNKPNFGTPKCSQITSPLSSGPAPGEKREKGGPIYRFTSLHGKQAQNFGQEQAKISQILERPNFSKLEAP